MCTQFEHKQMGLPMKIKFCPAVVLHSISECSPVEWPTTTDWRTREKRKWERMWCVVVNGIRHSMFIGTQIQIEREKKRAFRISYMWIPSAEALYADKGNEREKSANIFLLFRFVSKTELNQLSTDYGHQQLWALLTAHTTWTNLFFARMQYFFAFVAHTSNGSTHHSETNWTCRQSQMCAWKIVRVGSHQHPAPMSIFIFFCICIISSSNATFIKWSMD